MAFIDDVKPVINDTQNYNKNPRAFDDGVFSSSCQLKEEKPHDATPKDSIVALASKIAAQPLPHFAPEVWAVLTAVSTKALQRTQGTHIFLTADENIFGRAVDDVRFQIVDSFVSQQHCHISRKRVFKEDVEYPSGFCNAAFLIDTSTNGTFLNGERLKRGSSKSEAKLVHGDIISIAAPLQHDHAYTFVYREVPGGALLKRRSEDFGPENKKVKGVDGGASDNTVSLDDFRSLQQLNVDLNKKVENHVVTIGSLRKEIQEILEHHEYEMKKLREEVSTTYNDKLNKLNIMLEATKKELFEANKSSSEQKHVIEDLNDRLSAALQSSTEAHDIVKSQKSSLVELKRQLDNECNLRREEREKAAADQYTYMQKAQSEAEEKLRRVSDAASRRERELQEALEIYQVSERNSSLRVEELTSKLAVSDNKIHQLELQVLDERHSSDTRNKQLEELKVEIEKTREQLDKEKEAQYEAWACVMELQLELEYEKRKSKDAKGKIKLQEVQLNALDTIIVEIKSLFGEQKAQVRAMQNASEDLENHINEDYNASLNTADKNVDFGGFGSGIDGLLLKGNANGTEQVSETESPVANGEQISNLNILTKVARDTMLVQDETNLQETNMHGEDSDNEMLVTRMTRLQRARMNDDVTMEDCEG